METFYQVIGFIAAGLIVWVLYRTIKGRPQQFTRVNLSKSFFSMGILGLLLMGFVFFLVMLLRYS